MVFGWVNDDVVNEQINSIIEDVIVCVWGEILCGESLDECEECGVFILQVCWEVISGVCLCIYCQQEKDL